MLVLKLEYYEFVVIYSYPSLYSQWTIFWVIDSGMRGSMFGFVILNSI